LGLAIKAWGGCARGECLRIPLAPGSMLDRDEVWPPARDGASLSLPLHSARVEEEEGRLLRGRVMVHLPMQGRGNEADSGYGEVGWERVKWIFEKALPACIPHEPQRRAALASWARGYQQRFVSGLAQEVLGCVVSIVDGASFEAAQRLLALVAGLYGRSPHALSRPSPRALSRPSPHALSRRSPHALSHPYALYNATLIRPDKSYALHPAPKALHPTP
jgi:hypothetical protein